MLQPLQYFIVALLVIIFSTDLAAFNSQPKFTHLSVKQGLSQNTVNAIVEDNNGFIWIATNDGLNRYDGYDIKIYRKDSDNPQSLSSNVTKSLLLDSKGVLWVGTLNGLNRYNPENDNFTHFINKYPSPKSNRIFSLTEGSSNTLWLSNKNSELFSFNTNKYVFQHLWTIPKSEVSNSPSDRINKVLEDKQGNLWLGTHHGLYHINKESKETELFQFTYKGADTNKSNTINEILFITENLLLVGSLDGLYVLNIKTDSYQAHYHQIDNTHSLPSNSIEDIYQDRQQRIWLSTKFGISIFDYKHNFFTNYKHQSINNNSLASNLTLSLYQDRSDNLWVGTFDAGLSTSNLSSFNFGLHYSTKDHEDCLSNNSLYNILKASTGKLWVAAYGKGLHKINWPNGPCTWYHRDKQNPNSISSNNIVPTSLFEDSRGDIWFGSYDNALHRQSKGSNKFEKFQPNITNDSTVFSGKVRNIAEDKDGNLWMATHGEGLNCYNLNTNKFINYRKNPDKKNGISSPFIFDLKTDNNNELWIATENSGLDHYNVKKNLFTNYGGEYGFTNPLYSIEDDQNGNLWIGTGGSGLAKFNKTSHETTFYTTKDGLPNNTVYKVLMDNDGVLWLATNYGIARFDPRTNTSTNYTAKDGLQGNEFNVGGFYDKENNELFFVGSNGFNAFNPNLIKQNSTKPNTVITDFLLFNKPADSFLKQPISQLTKIKLGYYQNIFSFKFAGLHYTDPERNKYQYKLEGFDKQWISTNSKYRLATYTNLDPGSYTFKVKSSNPYGVWSDIREIRVVITPPLWLTWWAKLLYSILFISILLSVFWYRTHSLRKHAKLLEQEVTKQTHLLIKEKQQVEYLLLNKTKEFDNISHEFRTPLAIILGRAEHQLEQATTEEEKANINTISRVAGRLAVVVDDVIEMGRSTNLSPSSYHIISISSLVRDICENFREYAYLKQQQLTTLIEPDIYQSCLPKAIEKMVNNLLSNAVKYTHREGSIEVSLKRLSSEQYLLSVQDNGIGIDQKHQPHVFQRFYRCDNEYSQQIPGTGIGLSLVKEVVNTHNGTIELSSKKNEGTLFTVIMPSSNKMIEATHYSINQQHINMMMEPGSNHIDKNQQISNEKNNSVVNKQCHESNINMKPLILLVEDNQDMLLLLTDQLNDDYRLLTATNGDEGLQAAQQHLPQLIISDINMPKMNGYTLLNKLKSCNATSHIPVVLLTAKADAQSRITGFNHDADGYLAKPYDIEELLVVIQAQLKNREIMRNYVKLILESNKPLNSSQLDVQTNKVIDCCIKYIHKNYKNSSLCTSDLAAVACLSERQLLRKFQDVVGLSPSDFINQYRLDTARELVQQRLRISEVAALVGYNSANYFSRLYKKKFGLSPSQDVKLNHSSHTADKNKHSTDN